MSPALLPPDLESPALIIDAVAEEVTAPPLPLGHQEDLGPVSDIFPESWQYHP